MKKINTPLTTELIENLKAGEEILLSGTIHTARDQAHLRLKGMLDKGEQLPLDIKGKIIYYCGPAPAKQGMVIGSCGPTTSSRMDDFTPSLLHAGLKGMIGKGTRSKEVINSIKDEKAVYFLAPAGAGAYLAKRVKKSRVIAFKDLGPEAIYELQVEDFPLVVGVDSKGEDIHKRLK